MPSLLKSCERIIPKHVLTNRYVNAMFDDLFQYYRWVF